MLKPDKISSVLPQDDEEKKALIDLIDSCVETKEATTGDEEYGVKQDALIPQVASGNAWQPAWVCDEVSQRRAEEEANDVIKRLIRLWCI